MDRNPDARFRQWKFDTLLALIIVALFGSLAFITKNHGCHFLFTCFHKAYGIVLAALLTATAAHAASVEVRGQVFDDAGRPIVGAVLVYQSVPVAKSDGQGRYVLSFEKIDEIVIQVQAEGYIPLERRYRLPPSGFMRADVVLTSRPVMLNLRLAFSRPPTQPILIEFPNLFRYNRTVSAATDWLSISLEPGEIDMRVSTPGYLSRTEEFILKKGETRDLSLTLEPVPSVAITTAQPKPVILGRVEFAAGSAVVTAAAFETLVRLAQMIGERPGVLVIEGHTDNVGSREANYKLGMDRAMAVQYFLQSQGIAANRLEARSKGDVEPLVPNDTEENRQRNRHAEFMVREP